MLADELLLRALGTELLRRVGGARVEKVFQPRDDLLFLELHPAPEGRSLFLSTDRHYGLAGLVDRSLPNPAEPPTFCRLLRKHLTGARLAAATGAVGDRVLIFDFVRHEGGGPVTRRLELRLAANRPNLLLRSADGVLLGKLHDYAHHRGAPADDPDGAPLAQAPSLVTDEEVYVEALRDAPTSRELAEALPGLPPPLAELLFSTSHADEPARRKARWLVGVLLDGAPPSPALVTQPIRGTARLVSHVPPDLPEGATASVEADLLDAVARHFYLRGLEARREEGRRTVGRTIIERRRRLTRLRCSLDEGLKATGKADALVHRGELLKSVLGSIPPRASSVTATDWETGRPVVIDLDPTLSPKRNMERIFDKAKKARRALPTLERRLAAVDEELRLLTDLSGALERAVTDDEVKALADALARADLDREDGRRKPKRRSTAATRKGLRSYRSTDGLTIYVGRDARENDYLSRRMTSAADLWFHVRDSPGAHVVVKTAGRPSVPRTTVEEAAQLAAHFSGRRFDTRVEVHRCRGADVRRPAGAPLGTVTLRETETVAVRPDPAIVRRLLANEHLTEDAIDADGHSETS